MPQGFDGSFAQYNLYENHFSEILALVTYTGIGQSYQTFTNSSELTTEGMLPKAWRLIESDGIYLYKGGSSGAANTGNEPYSENQRRLEVLVEIWEERWYSVDRR